MTDKSRSENVSVADPVFEAMATRLLTPGTPRHGSITGRFFTRTFQPCHV